MNGLQQEAKFDQIISNEALEGATQVTTVAALDEIFSLLRLQSEMDYAARRETGKHSDIKNLFICDGTDNLRALVRGDTKLSSIYKDILQCGRHFRTGLIITTKESTRFSPILQTQVDMIIMPAPVIDYTYSRLGTLSLSKTDIVEACRANDYQALVVVQHPLSCIKDPKCVPLFWATIGDEYPGSHTFCDWKSRYEID